MGTSAHDPDATVLHQLAPNLTVGALLSGGVVSQVYSGRLDGQLVVVKHTRDFVVTYPAHFTIDKALFAVDAEVLRRLRGSRVRVPELIATYPDHETIVMEDLAAAGYHLLSESIISKRLPLASAGRIGAALAELARESRTWDEFPTVETPESSLEQRGLELRVAYPAGQDQYLEIVRRHLSRPRHWVWADAHPKNIFIDGDGNPAFIDFGESYWGDQAYMLANFIAHIVVFSVAGYISAPDAGAYITECVAGYDDEYSFAEPFTCAYVAMEILHRSTGRWLPGISSITQKSDLFRFGLRAYENARSITELIALLHDEPRR